MPAGKTTAGNSTTLRRRAIAWTLLALFPLLAWSALWTGTFAHRNQPVDTGDDLTDWYLKETVATTETWLLNESINFSKWLGSTPMGMFRSGVLDDAATQYGDDPRFWMLYHSCSPSRQNLYYTTREVLTKQQALEAAHDRGAVNAPVLLNLLNIKESQWEEDAARSVPPPENPLSWTPAQNRADIWAVIEAEHGEEHSALVDELLGAAPDEAQVYYHLARVKADRGSHERAMELIARGNRASLNTSMQGYPAWLLQDDEVSASIREDMLIGGWVGMRSFSDVTELLDTKKTFLHTLSLVQANRDIGQLAELHTYTCRLQSFDGTSSIGILQGLSFIEEVRRAFQGMPAQSPTRQQQAALAELDRRIADLNNEIKLCRTAPPTMLNLPLDLQQLKVAAKAWDAVSFGQSGSWLFIQNMHHDFTDKRRSDEIGLTDMMCDLARFDYATLTWYDEPPDDFVN